MSSRCCWTRSTYDKRNEERGKGGVSAKTERTLSSRARPVSPPMLLSPLLQPILSTSTHTCVTPPLFCRSANGGSRRQNAAQTLVEGGRRERAHRIDSVAVGHAEGISDSLAIFVCHSEDVLCMVHIGHRSRRRGREVKAEREKGKVRPNGPRSLVLSFSPQSNTRRSSPFSFLSDFTERDSRDASTHEGVGGRK